MKKLLIALLFSSMLFACEKKEQTIAQVKEALQKAVPDLPKDINISKSPIDGFYEVSVGRKVFYVSNDDKYLVFGNIIDVATKQNLTEKRTQDLSKIDFSKLPLDLAIKTVNGDGHRKIAVFSDPECPYCQMFEKQIASNLKDTTIYVFLFPLPNHVASKPDSMKIWCSNDRSATWTAWMRNKKPLPNNMSCDTSGLNTVYKIGTDVVQVEGTPTIILSNGKILPGMLPAEQLMPMMDEALASGAESSVLVKSSSSASF